MLSRRPEAARKILFRPLQHLRTSQRISNQRVFTHNAQLLLIARHASRPQLAYLSQPGLKRVTLPNGPSQNLARLLSTGTRQFVREQLWLATKWTAIGWVFAILVYISYFGVRLAIDETANPTPDEWNFSTRQFLRAARLHMHPKTAEETGFTDWAKIGSSLKKALELLEDTDRQGRGLVSQVEGEGILIPGVGKAGFDISAKSWPWRAGYYEVIMGCGRAAEHLDGMVLDKTRSMVFPQDVMIGPSNPDPRPVTSYMKAAPLEENCVAPFPGPETFYMRVLTGKGFTSKQKIDAALAYANWLDFKKLPESAEEMYKWAVDIAADGLPPNVDKDKVMDMETWTFRRGTGEHFATPNLLKTCTELATHFARNGSVTQALPVFLSVLRARREASVSPFLEHIASSTPDSGPDTFGTLRNIFRTPVFPSPPPSGDDPFTRVSDQPSCDESELMLYIGEILFATLPASSEGAGWTRQAVNIAEANLWPKSRSAISNRGHDIQKCKSCLSIGVANWEAMVKRLLNDQSLQANGNQRKSWFGSWSDNHDSTARSQALQKQQDQIAEIKERVAREGVDDKLGRSQSTNPSGVWIG